MSSVSNRLLFLEGNSDWYDTIQFRTSNLYNEPPPEPWVAFLAALVIGAFTMAYWYVRRWQPRRQETKLQKNGGWRLWIRTLISSLSDNDDPFYTFLRLACQALFFLGGFQQNFELTFIVMMVYYTIVSCGDSVRVLLSLGECTYLKDLTIVSKRDKMFLSDILRKEGKSIIALGSGNVYEDMSRNMMIVSMVFVTQVLLISFVVIDMYKTNTMTTFDGTRNVPIVGTFGSWCVYMLGIFMQSVYILGPNSSFGVSEQNPHFWLQLLLSAKRTGAKIQWYNRTQGEDRKRDLRSNDPALWIRFVMSFFINGIGYHLLVHALPIQIAGESSLLNIVFRAVGMVYLVNLDDTRGTRLIISEETPSKGTSMSSSSLGEDDTKFENMSGNDHAQQIFFHKRQQKITRRAQKQLQQVNTDLTRNLVKLDQQFNLDMFSSESSLEDERDGYNPYRMALVTNNGDGNGNGNFGNQGFDQNDGNGFNDNFGDDGGGGIDQV